MFDYIGSKVKVLAVVGCILGIIGSVILGVTTMFSGQLPLGIVYIVVGILISWLSSLTTYAIGESAENTESILNTLTKINWNQNQNQSQNQNQNQNKNQSIETNSINFLDFDNGNWTCSCGSKNNAMANFCPVCHKSRPKKQ